MSLTRKQFIQTSLALAAVGVLPSCSDDETDTGSGSPSSSGSGASGNGGSGASGSGGSGAAGASGPGGAGQGGGGAGQGGAGQGGGGAGQGGSGGTPSADCSGGADVMIGGHAGHMLVVPEADITAAADKTYNIANGLHPHDVTVTAAHFAQLAAGETVMVTSTSGGDPAHTHAITLVCG